MVSGIAGLYPRAPMSTREAPAKSSGRRRQRPGVRRLLGLLCVSATLSLLATAPSLSAPIPTNVPVTDTAPHAYQGPWVAVDPTEPRQLAVSFQDANGTNCWLGLSSNGGATWTEVDLAGPAGQGAKIMLPSGVVKCFRPSLTYGPDGTLYYAYAAGTRLTSGPGYNVIYLVASSDGGKTFGSPVPIDNTPLPSSGNNVNDQIPRVATDPKTGRLYVAWQHVIGRFSAENCLVASSTDQGRMFSNPVQVNGPDDDCGPVEAPDVGPGGRLYVSFQAILRSASGQVGPALADVAFSTNHGGSFSTPVAVQTSYECGAPSFEGSNSCPSSLPGAVSSSDPEVLAAPSGKDVYLTSYGLVDGVYRVQFSVSRDLGRTWSEQRTIGIPSGLSGDNQILPSIAVAPDGRLDIVYYDLATPSLLENTYLISSSDGGATFSKPDRISTVSSDTTIQRVFGNGPFDGGYLVASTSDTTYAAWTDSRRGNATNGKQDIFFSAAPLPRCKVSIKVMPGRVATKLSRCQHATKAMETGELLVSRRSGHKRHTRTYRLARPARRLSSRHVSFITLRLSRRLMGILASASSHHRGIAVVLMLAVEDTFGRSTVITLRVTNPRALVGL